MTITNIITGKFPTAKEMDQLKNRAVEIFRDPYAAPEQMEWAINIYPEGFAEMIPAESYHKGRMTEKWSLI